MPGTLTVYAPTTKGTDTKIQVIGPFDPSLIVVLPEDFRKAIEETNRLAAGSASVEAEAQEPLAACA